MNMQQGGCQALPYLPLPIFLTGMMPNTIKTEYMAPMITSSAHKNFELWTEEENRRFIQALEAESYPPDFSTVAARIGSKTMEQCATYAQLYFEALSRSRKLAERRDMSDLWQSQGISGSLHLAAADVYNFHGISPEGAAARPQIPSLFAGLGGPITPVPAAGSMRIISNSGNRGSHATADANHVSAGSKSSIAFLCEGDGSPASPHKPIKGVDGDKSKDQQAKAAATAKLGIKRKRQETPTEDMNREIDKCRVSKEDVWEYSSMQEAVMDCTRSRGKNPWDWARKAINRTSGYAQWWPLFAEHVAVTKREACEDLKIIRSKAPPPTPLEFNNPYSRKFDKNAPNKMGGGSGAGSPAAAAAGVVMKCDKKGPRGKSGRVSPDMEDMKVGKKAKKSDSKLQLAPGDFIEVKWGLDWWHAQVVKVGRTSRTGYVWVSYVGGTEEEEEWIAIDNCRAPREDVRDVIKGKGGMDSGRTMKKKSSTGA